MFLSHQTELLSTFFANDDEESKKHRNIELMYKIMYKNCIRRNNDKTTKNIWQLLFIK